MSGVRIVLLENMAHYIKTPLNAILGFSENLMSQACLNITDREMLAVIHHSGKDMLGMLNDLVEIDRIQRGSISLNRGTVDLRVLLENVENLMRSKLDFSGAIDIQVTEGLPRYILMDENRLTQVFVNLSTEIFEFDRQGDLCITINRKEGFNTLLCMISNSSTDHEHFDSTPGTAGDILDPGRKDLKPSLVLAALLIQYMGGSVSFRRPSNRLAAFAFEIGFEPDEVFRDSLDYRQGIRERLPDAKLKGRLHTIPQDLLAEMLDAVKRTRFDILADLIERSAKYSEYLAEGLRSLAKNYDYESILELLEPRRGSKRDQG